MTDFEILERIVKNRRSGKVAFFNGQKIEDEKVNQLLQLADWAPTHGHTEPWRFVVYAGEAVQKFGIDHAELYKAHTPEENFNKATYDKLQHNGDLASHLIAVYMKRGENPKIPAFEEVAATAAAVENILLGGEALGISILWSTGGMILRAPMKKYFSLSEEDTMLGLLYLGYVDNPVKEGKRIVPMEQKVTWVR